MTTYGTLTINHHEIPIQSKTIHTLLRENLIPHPHQPIQHMKNRHTLQTILGYILERRLFPHEKKLVKHYINLQQEWDITATQAQTLLEEILEQITDLDKTNIQYEETRHI